MYEVNKDTYALIGKGKKTEIIEKDQTFIIELPINTILKESCEYYGSSFEGRKIGSQKQLGMCYKLPIIIESTNEIVMFPINSPNSNNCSWLSLTNIKNYKKVKTNSLITFNNNKSRLFPVSIASLENQMFRASKLLLINKKRRSV